MLSPLRNRFGIPGVISVIALVFAMLGGAYAANSDNGGKATASAKGKQGPRGKTGKTGPAGPAGPAGPQGPAGAKGDAGAAGANGKDGTNGTNGTNGKSVSVTAVESGLEGPLEECEERGGSVVEVAGEAATAAEICNGEEGPPGSPWTLNGTLPTDSTETGAWSFNVSETDAAEIVTVVSFPIPLTAGLSGANVHFESDANFSDFDEAGEGTIGCSGTTNLPKAPSGHLCVFGASNLQGAVFKRIEKYNHSGVPGAHTTGAILVFERSPGATEPIYGGGSFAVTG